MSMKAKLYGGFGTVLAVLVLGAAGIWVYTFSVTRDYKVLEGGTVGATELANVERMIWSLRFGIANYPGADEQGRAKIVADEAGFYKELKRALAAYSALDLEPDEKSALDRLSASISAYMGSRPKWFELFNAGKLDEAKEWRAANTNKFGAETVKGLKELIEMQKSVSDARNRAMSTAMQMARTELVFCLLLLVAATTVLCVFLARALTRAIGGEPDYASDVVSKIAAGDLGVEIASRPNDTSSLLASMKGMQQELSGMVLRIKQSAETIHIGAAQIASGNADLSVRTEQQAASLEETAASMRQLTSTVSQNVDDARQANELAGRASQIAVKGGQVVGEVVTTMGQINDSSKKIADIIGVIDGIAFQTNILALNAAVEAARAGEQGRGFAVVASEVRSLAQRSAAAAKEIKTLIEDSVGKVGAGAKLVHDAGDTMAEVVGSIKRVTDIMAGITAASEEQSSGIGQVNDALAQMDQVTQQNAALVEEAAAAAETMQSQARELSQAVAVFRLAATPARTAAVANHASPSGSTERRVSPPSTEARTRGATRGEVTPLHATASKPSASGTSTRRKTGTTDEWTEF